MLAFALSGSFALALGAFWLTSLARTVSEPLYLTWLNEGVDPRVRATVISIGSQSGALGEASAGPVVGAIGNLAGVRSALTLAALILSLRSCSTLGPSGTVAPSLASKTPPPPAKGIRPRHDPIPLEPEEFFLNSDKSYRSFVDVKVFGA
jgi:hypothetical protein